MAQWLQTQRSIRPILVMKGQNQPETRHDGTRLLKYQKRWEVEGMVQAGASLRDSTGVEPLRGPHHSTAL